MTNTFFQRVFQKRQGHHTCYIHSGSTLIVDGERLFLLVSVSSLTSGFSFGPLNASTHSPHIYTHLCPVQKKNHKQLLARKKLKDQKNRENQINLDLDIDDPPLQAMILQRNPLMGTSSPSFHQLDDCPGRRSCDAVQEKQQRIEPGSHIPVLCWVETSVLLPIILQQKYQF